MIQAVVFDCFGVLHETTFREVYRSFGGDPEADKEIIERIYDDAHNGRNAGSAAAFSARLGISVQQWADAIRASGEYDMPLLEYVDRLKEHYKVAILTNVSAAGLKAHMDVSVLEQHFPIIIESSAIGIAKPAAGAYDAVVQALDVDYGDCVMIDDNEGNCDGARAVGMQAIMFKDLEQFQQEFETLTGKKI